VTLPLAYPDAELVLIAVHRNVTGVTYVGTWIPEEPEPGTIIVQRIGGGPDPEDQTDYPLFRVLYYGDTRQEAIDLSREGERWVKFYSGRAINRPGDPAHGVLIDSAGVDVNGTLDEDLDPDERRVVKNYLAGLRRQYHLVAA
jgi:hypothetical protein